MCYFKFYNVPLLFDMKPQVIENYDLFCTNKYYTSLIFMLINEYTVVGVWSKTNYSVVTKYIMGGVQTYK